MATDTATLKERLRGAGLRATASRVSVLRLLLESNKPLSHSEVAESLKDGGWDRATVYRNLVDLADVGIASKVELGDRVWRFYLGGPAAHDDKGHPHFVCLECGDVACLPESAMSFSDQQSLPRALKSHNVQVQIRGLCDSCE